MKPSDVQHLLALDTLGEITAEQRAELDRVLEEQPSLKAERDRMRAAFRYLDRASRAVPDLGPLGCSMPARVRRTKLIPLEDDEPSEDLPLMMPQRTPPPNINADSESMPPAIRERLIEARRRDLAELASSRSEQAKIENVVAFDDRAGAVEASHRVRRRQLLTWLARAALIALLVAPVAWWLLQKNTGSRVVATAAPALAPRGETGMTQPMFVWDNLPGQTYNVWILGGGAKQDADALFQAENVTSPLPFAKLKPGRGNPEKAAELKPGTPYVALVCLAEGGRFAGVTVPFRTAPAALGAPPSPSETSVALSLVQLLLDAGRTADALMVIAGLPESIRKTEKLSEIESRIRQSLKSE